MIIRPHPAAVAVVLFRRWKASTIATFAVIALGAAYLLLVAPLYRSEASVVVRFDEKTLPDTNMAHDTAPQISSQNDRHETVLANAEILGSRDLAQHVIEAIGMERMYPTILADPPWLGTPLDEAIRVFLKNLSVEPDQQGDVIAITFQHHDPELAREATRRLIAGYMQRESTIFSSSDFTFQQQQLDRTRTQLVIDQAALANFKAGTGISAYSDQIAALIRQRSDIVAGLGTAAVSLIQTGLRRDELHNLLGRLSPTVQSSANGEKYRAGDDADSRLAELRLKERQMLATYNPDSPMLAQLRAAIAAAEADAQHRGGAVGTRDSVAPNIVYQTIQTDLLRASAENRAIADSLSVLRAQLASLDEQLRGLEAQRTRLDDLSRAVDIDDGAYRSLALHLEDARVAANRVRDRISHAAVISGPSLPYKSAKPRYVLMIAIIAVASLLAGAGAAIVAELADDRFHEPGQIEQAMGIAVLASFGELAG